MISQSGQSPRGPDGSRGGHACAVSWFVLSILELFHPAKNVGKHGGITTTNEHFNHQKWGFRHQSWGFWRQERRMWRNQSAPKQHGVQMDLPMAGYPLRLKCDIPRSIWRNCGSVRTGVARNRHRKVLGTLPAATNPQKPSSHPKPWYPWFVKHQSYQERSLRRESGWPCSSRLHCNMTSFVAQNTAKTCTAQRSTKLAPWPWRCWWPTWLARWWLSWAQFPRASRRHVQRWKGPVASQQHCRSWSGKVRCSLRMQNFQRSSGWVWEGKQNVCMCIYIYIHTNAHTLPCLILPYLHYTTLHYITLHYTTLHYITLHCTTLHYITLHYITLH